MPLEDREKTVFVSIACIGNDTELIRTVRSCVENAENPKRIYVGINLVYGQHISDNESYIYSLEQELSNIKNARYVVTIIKNPLSIARDRNVASKLYRGEDYILQIDAHCYFTSGWDAELIKSLEEAQKITNNKKTLLTATLPKYNLNENAIVDIPVPEMVAFGYGFWENEFLDIFGDQPEKNIIPSWRHTFPEMLSWRLEKLVQSSGFAPALKTTGAFVFGNKHYADHMLIAEHVVFWEEEIIHSIELLWAGFSFVYPYIRANVYHYYQIEQTNTGRGHRSGIGQSILASVLESTDLKADQITWEQLEVYNVAWREQMYQSFKAYMENEENQEKVKKFEKYSGMNFKTGLAAFEFPLYYANRNAIPIEEETHVG